MIQLGAYRFKSFLDYYTHVMKRYFRKIPPVPSNVYLSSDVIKSDEQRRLVAKHCRVPAIINILVNAEDDQIRKMVYKNDFWILCGQFQDILGFEKKERKKFARVEGQYNLVILLMFEDDLDILADLLHNPAVSVKMLAIFLKLLKMRGRGRKDEQIFDIAQQVLKEKKNQIVKVAEIKKLIRGLSSESTIRRFLSFLSDEDPTIRQAVLNQLTRQEANTLHSIIHTALLPDSFSKKLEQFRVISEILHLCNKREDLQKTPLSYLKNYNREDDGGLRETAATFFNRILLQKQFELVEQSSENLTDFDNIILLTYCHIHRDSQLRRTASKIISISEIINLLNEVSTPRRVFKTVLNILSMHKDESVAEMVHNTHIHESHRLKESLKELEISVQAYFDIIFRSLGYNQINEYQNVVRSVLETEKQINRFSSLLGKELGTKQRTLKNIFEDVKQIMNNRARVIYFDISPKTIKDLEYILSLIEEILTLKDMGFTSLRPGTPEDIETEIKIRARIIWRSAISIYLGRIKDLTEMTRTKLLQIHTNKNEQDLLHKEIRFAEKEIENAHKTKTSCSLFKTCSVCSRRGCAAERFLSEAHFFISEFLDAYAQK